MEAKDIALLVFGSITVFGVSLALWSRFSGRNLLYFTISILAEECMELMDHLENCIIRLERDGVNEAAAHRTCLEGHQEEQKRLFTRWQVIVEPKKRQVMLKRLKTDLESQINELQSASCPINVDVLEEKMATTGLTRQGDYWSAVDTDPFSSQFVQLNSYLVKVARLRAYLVLWDQTLS